MALFSRLFKKKEPETLEQKIAKLDDKSGPERLELAKQAPEVELRAAAVAHLPYSQDLLNLAQSDDVPVAIAARKRLGSLLDQGELTVDALSKKVRDPAALLQLCAYSGEAAVDLVAQVQDQAMLLSLAESAPTTQQRQAAAAKISDREQLQSLAKTAREKDKSVYKIVKSKLDVFKQQQQQDARRLEEIRSLCAQMEQLGKREPDDIFIARLNQLNQAWEPLAAYAPAEEQGRFLSAADRCRQKLAQQASQKAEESQLKEEENAAKTRLGESLDTLEHGIVQLYNAQDLSTAWTHFAPLQQAHADALQQASSKHGLDTRNEARRGASLQEAATALMADLNKHGTLSTLNDRLHSEKGETAADIRSAIDSIIRHAKVLQKLPQPEIVSISKKNISSWTEERTAQEEAKKQRLRKVNDLLRRGRWAIDNGHVGRARAILRDIHEQVTRVEALPEALEAKVAELQAAIDKLGDWHHFAVTPKKEALIAQMQALVGSDLAPLDQANRVQQLQEAWRELSRGGQNQDESLWQQFQAASRAAYEVCEVHFKEQNQLRGENANNRKLLLAQLRQYLNAYNWDSADWKEVEKTLKISRDAWQSYWPIPRKLVKDLQAEFDELMDALYAKLNAEYERSRLKKQNLVERAQKLTAAGDSRAAIEEVKQLQQQWQLAGRCKRKDDQNLWKEFRKHCDAVFEKRQSENEQSKQEREAAQREAETVIAELETLLAQDGQALLNARDQIDALVQRFKAIGELPRDCAKSIAIRFESVTEKIEQKLAKERIGVQRRRWLDVLAAADAVRRYELQLLAGKESQALTDQVSQVLEGASVWPAGAYSQLELRLNSAKEITEDQQPVFCEALKNLCIRSEVALGKDSPAEDKAARMQFQVRSLQQGLGQAELPDDGTLADIILNWVAVPAVPDAEYSNYLKRLNDVWNLGISTASGTPPLK